ncbi:uncharacterized protein LOC113492280 [Trichoplusia ni]|uniref:Uncharacterized protein LOC113492280 n=1 Tax=Trichoplusia ni TaxID=7111 RepID=A0A7E5VB63_TRINI|nr:uncharacterized protein LOC113492280 [Trichoplusia ni]
MKPSQAWYPAARESLRGGVWDNNNDADLSFELRQDERLHPGQQLNVDFTSPGRLYGADFQVRDHTLSGGVWLYNTRDTDLNQNCGLPSTDHVSTESPGKSTVPGQFQMAPGGERRKSTQELSNQKPEASVEELEQRLNNLRGFKL